MVGMTLAFATTSHAQTIAPQTCSTGVWQTMEDRARLETQREIMQNQNLIFKADSVLSYTCFDRFAAHGARHLGRLFTHTTYWNGRAIFPEGGTNDAPGMGAAVQNAVVAAMSSYIQGNFHGSGGGGGGGGGGADSGGSTAIPLGGRGSEFGLGAPAITPVPTGGGDYSCGEMSRVWNVAKCMNFMHTDRFAQTDGFYPFKDLAGVNGTPSIGGYESRTGIRNFPQACGSDATPVPGGWAEYTDYSRNLDGTGYNGRYEFETNVSPLFNNVREYLVPSICAAAIPTGVQVILSPGAASTAQPDGVCTNPGCSYVDGACVVSSGSGEPIRGAGGQQ